MSDAAPTSVPIYNDRTTGENFPDATSMINAYLKRYAEATPMMPEDSNALDATGYAQVLRGGAVVGINVLEELGVLMVFAPVMRVPKSRLEAFYRKLLELSFVTTSDAAFAINTRTEEVVVRCLRRLSALDYEEFEDIITTVGNVADRWADALQDELESDGSPFE